MKASASPLRLGKPGQDPLSGLYATEAEQALLGALLFDNRAYEHVADIVSAEDFGNGVHGRIFDAIGKMIGAGQQANPVTLRPIFEQDETLAPVDGSKYLARLFDSTVTVINAPSYARQIADLARRRDIVLASQDTIADAARVEAERDAESVLDEAEERLFKIAEGTVRRQTMLPLGSILSTVIDNIETAYKQGGAVTVDTGLSDLDRIICGMGAGDLDVMAGRPSMGKSALALTVAYNAARKGKRVMLFSLEMTRAELAQRWLAGMTGISTDRQRHGQLDTGDWQRVTEAQAYLSRLPIIVDDQGRLSVAQMRQRARRMRRRHGLDLIIVDHLQLIRQGGRQENRRLEIGDATSMLKAVAKELAVPILLLSQLSRAPEQRTDKRPMLSDLRESGDIEQDADVVMLLYREEYYLERSQPKRQPGQTAESFLSATADWDDRLRHVRGQAEIAVAKNRHGRTGSIEVYFDAARQRFEGLAHDGI